MIANQEDLLSSSEQFQYSRIVPEDDICDVSQVHGSKDVEFSVYAIAEEPIESDVADITEDDAECSSMDDVEGMSAMMSSIWKCSD